VSLIEITDSAPDPSTAIIAAMLQNEGFTVPVEDTTRSFAESGLMSPSLIVAVERASRLDDRGAALKRTK
jgi:type 1 glutamine amidotransferase